MKKTPNKIRAELRRQMAHNQNKELEKLRAEKHRYTLLYHDSRHEIEELRIENSELGDKVKQYEDWNRRLMEFMDMTDEDRQKAIEEIEASLANQKRLHILSDLYTEIFKTIFN